MRRVRFLWCFVFLSLCISSLYKIMTGQFLTSCQCQISLLGQRLLPEHVLIPLSGKRPNKNESFISTKWYFNFNIIKSSKPSLCIPMLVNGIFHQGLHSALNLFIPFVIIGVHWVGIMPVCNAKLHICYKTYFSRNKIMFSNDKMLPCLIYYVNLEVNVWFIYGFTGIVHQSLVE